MVTPILEIRAACRDFDDRKALQSVDLEVAAGEIVALLGPNGAGKTSLMRSVSGRLRLDSGTVRVCGHDPYKETAVRQSIGIVPQTIALYPQLSIRENLEVFARLAGLAGDQVGAAIASALQRAGLADRSGDKLGDLSGGMQRRINIVAGTLHAPQLLLLDEPTVGVDLSSRQRIHDLLADLRSSGMAILVSTHDFDQAAAVAGRVVFMSGGKVLMEGRVDELITSVFGVAKELCISLAVAPDAADEQLLRQLKLTPLQDRMAWSGPVEAGVAAMPEIEQSLETAGLRVTQMMLREPGLQSVYMHLTSEEKT